MTTAVFWLGRIRRENADVTARSATCSLAVLLAGTVDYTLLDVLVVQYIVNNYPKEAGTRLQMGSTPPVKRELHFVVRRSRPDAESIIDRFNAQLRNMITDRTRSTASIFKFTW